MALGVDDLPRKAGLKPSHTQPQHTSRLVGVERLRTRGRQGIRGEKNELTIGHVHSPAVITKMMHY